MILGHSLGGAVHVQDGAPGITRRITEHFSVRGPSSRNVLTVYNVPGGYNEILDKHMGDFIIAPDPGKSE